MTKSFFRALAVLFAISAAAFSVSAEERLALIIAQSNYDTSLGRLDSTFKDADILGEALRETGFEVTDRRDLDKDQIRREVLSFAGRLEDAGSDAVGVLYFTGHGAAISDDSDNFLIPVGAYIERANDLVTEAYKLGDAIERLERTGAAHVFVIVDACRNVPFAASNKSAHKGFSVQQAKAGMLIAYATAPGTTAAADNLYSTALAKAVRTPGIEALPMFKSVRIAVLKATGGSQFPWTREAMTGDFYFTLAAPAEEAPTEEESAAIILAEAPPIDLPPPGPARGSKAPAAGVVNGYSVTEVIVPDWEQPGRDAIRFTLLPNGQWEEIGMRSDLGSFIFDESARDEWSVYLADPTRDVWLQLDVARNQIFYRDPSLEAPRWQYNISRANADPVEGRVAKNPSRLRRTDVDLNLDNPGWTTRNVTAIGGASFRTGDGVTWTEYRDDGTPAFTFRELQRDDWSVYLFDESRNVYLQIDLYKREVLYRPGDQSELAPIMQVDIWD